MRKGQKLRAAKVVTPHVVTRNIMEAYHKILVTARGPIFPVIATLLILSNMARLRTIKALKGQGLKAEIHSQAVQSGATLVM